MTQYEGIRTASDLELEEAYSRLISTANVHGPASPMGKAATRWLQAVIDEADTRKGPRDSLSRLPCASGYWLNGCWITTGDPGDEYEA